MSQRAVVWQEVHLWFSRPSPSISHLLKAHNGSYISHSPKHFLKFFWNSKKIFFNFIFLNCFLLQEKTFILQRNCNIFSFVVSGIRNMHMRRNSKILGQGRWNIVGLDQFSQYGWIHLGFRRNMVAQAVGSGSNCSLGWVIKSWV